jgi:hypothetical protein
MRRALLAAAAALLATACHDSAKVQSLDANAPSLDANTACPACLTDKDCASGSVCAQFSGDSFCAPACSGGSGCASDRSCATLTSAEGAQVEACLPMGAVCGPLDPDGGVPPDSGANPGMCGSLAAPTTTAGCHCSSGQSCAPNGCYGGWWCDTSSNRCQRPPSSTSCGPVGPPADAGPPPDVGPLPDGSINGNGGTLADLRFAIVGDTRPASENDTAGYPTAIATQIWQGVAWEQPQFAVTTGDYMFASSGGGQVSPQLDLYLGARSNYGGWVYPTMGNHECTGRTASNCGLGNADGMTENYQGFLDRLLGPLGQMKPYYSVHLAAADGTWTAKFVFVAANAWDQDQATWLDSELALPTTYTFMVRHEGAGVGAPGVAPSDASLGAHPYTLLIAGHSHTFEYRGYDKEVIIGNGGAPISGSVNYGYVIAERRADGAIQFSAKDYQTRAVFSSFVVQADGTGVQ